MANIDNVAHQWKDLSVFELREQLLVAAKGLLDAKVSQNTVRKPSSVLKRRRQIARLLTYLSQLKS